MRLTSGFAALILTTALAACAGFESAGRSAEAGGASAPPVAAASSPVPSAAAPPPAPSVASADAPAAAITPPVSLPQAPPSAQEQQRVRTAANNNEIIVPGTRQQQVPAPNGDPRTASQRMEDIRAWDRCVMRVHNQGEADPMKPQLEDPEDYCRRSLGMASRLAVPAARQP